MEYIAFIYYKFFVPVFFRFDRERGFRAGSTLLFLIFVELLPALIYIYVGCDNFSLKFLFVTFFCIISFMLAVTILKVVGFLNENVYNASGSWSYIEIKAEGRSYALSNFSEYGEKKVTLAWSVAIIVCLYVSLANVIFPFSNLSDDQINCFGDLQFSKYFYTIVTLPPKLDICTAPVTDNFVKVLRYVVNAMIIGALLTEATKVAYRKK